MKMTHGIAITLLLVNEAYGLDGTESLKEYQWINAVTPTNMILKFSTDTIPMHIWQKGSGVRRRQEPGEEMALIPDQETIFFNGNHVQYVFTPISFKNQQKGFRISYITYWWPDPARTNRVYIALDDTPIEMREEDVDMIMENGELKKSEGDGGAKTSLPNHEEPQPVTQDESVATVSKPSREEPPPTAETEPPAGNATPSHGNLLPVKLILAGALLTLCLFAILYFLRGKMKR